MNDEWYITYSGQQHGPFTLDSVRQQVQSGQLPEDVLFWKDGMTDWMPSSSIPDLHPAPQAAVPTASETQGEEPGLPAPSGTMRSRRSRRGGDAARRAERPLVVLFVRLYGAIMGFMYAAIIVIFLAMMIEAYQIGQQTGKGNPNFIFLMAPVFLLMFGLIALCWIPAFGPRRPWIWKVGTGALSLGLLSPPFWVIVIPLLLFWTKPVAKAYYGIE